MDFNYAWSRSLPTYMLFKDPVARPPFIPGGDFTNGYCSCPFTAMVVRRKNPCLILLRSRKGETGRAFCPRLRDHDTFELRNFLIFCVPLNVSGLICVRE